MCLRTLWSYDRALLYVPSPYKICGLRFGFCGEKLCNFHEWSFNWSLPFQLPWTQVPVNWSCLLCFALLKCLLSLGDSLLFFLYFLAHGERERMWGREWHNFLKELAPVIGPGRLKSIGQAGRQEVQERVGVIDVTVLSLKSTEKVKQAGNSGRFSVLQSRVWIPSWENLSFSTEVL